MKEWLRSLIADATRVQLIVNNAMDQGLDSLQALAEVNDVVVVRLLAHWLGDTICVHGPSQ